MVSEASGYESDGDVPGPQPLDVAVGEVVDGVVQALVLGMSDVVPLVVLELSAEALHHAARASSRRVDEIRGGVVAGVGAVLEPERGEEEGEDSVAGADGACDRVAVAAGCVEDDYRITAVRV